MALLSVVMQSFEYTPEQNSLFGDGGRKSEGGETDFLVFGGGYCVILEVKRLKDLKWYDNPTTKKSASERRRIALKRLLSDGIRQSLRTKILIEELVQTYKSVEKDFKIFKYILIGGLSSKEATDLLGKTSEIKLGNVIFIDDYLRECLIVQTKYLPLDLKGWWAEEVYKSLSENDKLYAILLN